MIISQSFNILRKVVKNFYTWYISSFIEFGKLAIGRCKLLLFLGLCLWHDEADSRFPQFCKRAKKKAALQKLKKQSDSHSSSLTLQARRNMAVAVTDNVWGIPHSAAILGTALDQSLITRTICPMIYG